MRDIGLAKDRRGKASGKNLFAWSLVDPAVASRRPRPKAVVAPPVETFLFV
jgi:hypothetical protein